MSNLCRDKTAMVRDTLLATGDRALDKCKLYAKVLLGGAGVALLVFIVIYAAHSRLAMWHLDRPEGLFWEIVIKAIAGYVAVLGAVITAFRYIDEKARQREQDLNALLRQWEQDRREDRKAFLLERQAIYRRLGLSLANIMNHDPDDPRDNEIWIAAKENFFEIYWGEIRLVADKRVLNSVKPFSDTLDSARTRGDKELFGKHVAAIMDACRKSLGDAWSDIREAERATGDGILKPFPSEQPLY